jgi:hypothetical protein
LGNALSARPPSPSPPSMPEPIDGFEFGMTVYNDKDKDTIRLS